ncbi:MAG: hypothetical protein IJP58_00965 [Clostridia bacterium]|nr:hypothetical protein [Clostridia bacterium]MBR0027204.1 hypothetical protein [Clostridia bacterium]
MSKKDRRKSGKKIGAKPLPRVEFDIDSSRSYLLATLLIFHVVPLIFIVMQLFMRDQNIMGMYLYFAIYFNSMLVAAIGFIYGLKKGFNVKFPIVISIIAALSIVFYGGYLISETFNVLFAFGITYALFAFGSVLLGAFLKKTFNFE